MTRKAHDIGMTSTTFKNASGLPDPEQTTTARDMLTLALHLQRRFPAPLRAVLHARRSTTAATATTTTTVCSAATAAPTASRRATRSLGLQSRRVGRPRRQARRRRRLRRRTARVRDTMMEQVLNKALAKASTKVTRKPSLVARAPQPARAASPPVEVAEAPRAAEPPPPATAARVPAVRERETSIAVAKVRAVRIGEDARAPRVERVELTPSPAQPVFAVAGAGGSMPPARDAGEQSQAFPRFVPETGALQPSTLQAQAAQLEGAGMRPLPRRAPLAALAPEAPRTPATRNPGARGPFEIQIGAFGDSAEAERRMAAARQRAGGILDPYRSVAIPVQSGSSKLYRARFRRL